ncbi:MAG: aldehyde dehydrogenase family protein [Gammaproteobacteria bacterium]|nr:aldehyde dehydrogenase family protein [Gammaproteobacteria bacterium]MDH4253325.1 aldehyde dehydrogenase family protein [Gammaproteobacteria bacterium]MDH5309934.1 aldehyde dehydrogenase family protein [Gammaproteobacteria bacterium]
MSNPIPTDLFIGNAWTPASGGRRFSDLNPATGKEYAAVADANRDDARKAIDSAASAQPAWAAMSHPQRARIMTKIADVLESRQADFVDALSREGGAWFGKGMFETSYAQGIYRAAAAAAYQVEGQVLPSEHGKLSLVVRQPLGVVAVVSPWNFPLLLTSRGLAFALAIGNTIVLKPSEETPVSGGLLLAEVFAEAGLPEGVVNVVTCSRDSVREVGDEMVSNPHVKAISFTGSSAVGAQIAAQAGSLLKRACIEAGGKDALIVLEDADMERAVNAATFGKFMHQGQICMAVERILVQDSIADEFTARYVENVKKLKMGDPADKSNVLGPIINKKQLDNIHRHVTEAVELGARLLTGGKHDGLYYEPTVLTNVTRRMKVFTDETFGPVAPILTFGSVDEAIEIANDSVYGLSAGIITRNEELGLAVARRLQTGMAHINDSSVNDEPHVPFGGVKYSGLGRHGGKWSIDTFSETRWITLDRGHRLYPPAFNMG